MLGVSQLLAVEAVDEDDACDQVINFLEGLPTLLDTQENTYDVDAVEIEDIFSWEEGRTTLVDEISDAVGLETDEVEHLKEEVQQDFNTVISCVFGLKYPDEMTAHERATCEDAVELLNRISGVYRCDYPFYDIVEETCSTEQFTIRLNESRRDHQWVVKVLIQHEDRQMA